MMKLRIRDEIYYDKGKKLLMMGIYGVDLIF